MEYKVITWREDETIKQRSVPELVADGWRLQGGVSVCVSTMRGNNELIYAQALIRTVKPEQVHSPE